MKRLFMILVISTLVTCGNDTQKNSENGAITLTLAHHLSETDSNNILAEEFVRLVYERSSGRVKIDIYPNNQLGGQKELLEGLGVGSVDFSMSDTGLLANYDSAIGILELPYNYTTIDEARKTVESELGNILKQRILEKSQIEVLTMEVVAFRDVVLSKKNISDKASFSGLRVRTPENPVLVNTFKILGANPTVIPSGEAYTALETGVVDGMEGNKEFLTDSIRVFEVAKKWFYTKHGISITSINMSPFVKDKVSPADMDIIRKAAVDSLPVFYEYTKKLDETYTKILTENGVEFYDVDTESLKQGVKPVIDQFLQQDPKYVEYYNEYIRL